MALFIILYGVVLTKVSGWNPKNVIIQRKSIQQNFSLMLFIMLCKVVLTSGSLDEISKCDHLIEG